MREGTVQAPGGNVWYKIEGKGSRVPLLVLHGRPGAGHDYLEPLGSLGDERPVVFYDQLGCGRSDIPDDISLWTISRFVREISAVREALGLDRIHLLGQSWGGWLAIEYMLDHPDGIASLTLCNTSASATAFEAGARSLLEGLPEDVRQAIERSEAEGTTQSPEYLAASFAFMRQHLCRLEVWPECLARTGVNVQMSPVYRHMWGPSEFTMTGNLAGWDRTRLLGEINTPTLVISGPYGEMVPELADELSHGIPGAHAVMIEDTSHTPWIENPDAFFTVLRDFLRRNEPA
jgi:proline iminopeptidase